MRCARDGRVALGLCTVAVLVGAFQFLSSRPMSLNAVRGEWRVEDAVPAWKDIHVHIVGDQITLERDGAVLHVYTAHAERASSDSLRVHLDDETTWTIQKNGSKLLIFTGTAAGMVNLSAVVAAP